MFKRVTFKIMARILYWLGWQITIGYGGKALFLKPIKGWHNWTISGDVLYRDGVRSKMKDIKSYYDE